MLHNDARAQMDFADWMARHRQDEREAEIRRLASEYVERCPGGSRGPDVAQFNTLAFPWAGVGAAYLAPNGSYGTTTIHSIHICVDPYITGFARQIIAENCIREQLDLTDEPCDY